MKALDSNHKKTKILKRFNSLFSLMILGFFLMGCAFGTDRVKLYDPLTYKPASEEGVKEAYADVSEIKPISGEKIQMVIKKIRDDRLDSSKIGVKKNSYGMTTGKVDVEEGVIFLDLFTKNLINCFESAGYEAIPIKTYEGTSPTDKGKVKAFIEPEIRMFWVEPVMGFFTVGTASNVAFEVRLFEPETNRELWKEIFRGQGKASGVAVTRGMFEKSINLAYAEAMRNFYKAISDEKIRNMFGK